MRPRAYPLAAILIGIAVVAGAGAAMLQRIEPFTTWFYVFAWYGTLLAMDGAAALTRGAVPAENAGAPSALYGLAGLNERSFNGAPGGNREGVVRGRFFLLGRRRFALTLFAWSAVAWLFFELLNFRLRNWYYIFVPDGAIARWSGILLSFATVIPAIFTAEAVLAGLGTARRVRWPAFRVTPRLLRGIQLTGLIMFVLPLIWPRYFFPLAWGGVFFLIEPHNYRREPERSLLGDLERGRPGRALRLLLAGLAVGILWEFFNIEARGKWIYTVPGLEELKIFEMPVLGFLGFPPFALECFAIWQMLVIGGLAVPRFGRTRPTHGPGVVTRLGAALAAIGFGAAVFLGMETRTISSRTPRLTEVPGVPAGALIHAGYNVFSLADASIQRVAGVTGASPSRARDWIQAARLATLRGIGTGNARRLRRAGITTVAELARADPDALARRLESGDHGLTAVVPARVDVWVRAAREAVGGGRS